MPVAIPESIQTDSIPKHNVLGVHFSPLTSRQTLDLIDRFITEKKPRRISFSNAHIVSEAFFSQEIKDVINGADLVLPDGMSIVFGGKVLGYRFPERVAGPDLMVDLCARAAEKQYRVFLFGSSWQNLRQLKSQMLARWPSINIVGFHSPPICDEFSQEENNIVTEKVKETKPDILFVGLSTPKQDKWLAKQFKTLDVPVCLAVGAAFDYMSGKLKRAPLGFRKVGLEWFYRLCCDPKRLWKRYFFEIPVFLTLLLKEGIATRIRR